MNVINVTNYMQSAEKFQGGKDCIWLETYVQANKKKLEFHRCYA